jgi:hypothetical protein
MMSSSSFFVWLSSELHLFLQQGGQLVGLAVIRILASFVDDFLSLNQFSPPPNLPANLHDSTALSHINKNNELSSTSNCVLSGQDRHKKLVRSLFL